MQFFALKIAVICRVLVQCNTVDSSETLFNVALVFAYVCIKKPLISLDTGMLVSAIYRTSLSNIVRTLLELFKWDGFLIPYHIDTNLHHFQVKLRMLQQ